jgi:protein-S-isoprenylcysteine O-methyltransferase Ste14
MTVYWPALVFGIVLTAYWGRVLRLVYKIRRQTGRDANFRPPERTGQWLRVIWYPAVAIWVGYPYLVAFTPHGRLPMALRPTEWPAGVGWAAAVVGAAALLGTLVCWKRMGKSWRMGINPDEKTQLIVSGPYAYVRHPIYALSSLLMLATMAAIPSPLMLAVGVIHLGLLQWEAKREEKYLVVHHGPAYEEYCRRVGRFVPRSFTPFASGETLNARP